VNKATFQGRPGPDAPRKEIFESYLQQMPLDDDELHFWIRTFTGFDIPRRAVCAGHDAPFAFLADQFFERESAAIALGSRTSGKRRIVAILNLCDMLFKPGITIAEFGAVKQQVETSRDYLCEMLAAEPLLYELFASIPRGGATLLNGSKITFGAASYGGLSGGHPTKVRLGDVELVHAAMLPEVFSLSVGHKDGWKAQTTLFTHRKVPSGTAAKVLNEAAARGMRVYDFCVWEVLQRCTRECEASESTYADCPAWKKRCHGRAHFLSDGGWYSIDDFVAKGQLLDDETWATQWENKAPAKEQA
jgi:hypothetical protein